MDRKCLCLCFLVFGFLRLGIAQNSQIIRLQVYFETAKAELRALEKMKIKACVDTLDSKSIASIVLKGHTDSRADSLYNIQLSQKRVEAVYTYLKTLHLESLIAAQHALGENLPLADNSSETGMQKNRRVDLNIKINLPEKINKVDTPVRKPELTVIDTCRGDTVLQVGSGLQFQMDRCNAKKLKDCIEVETINNITDLERVGLNMQDEAGNNLISDGMFRLQWKANCGPACENFKMKWLLTEEEFKSSGFNFYQYDEERGVWGSKPQNRIKRLVINKVKYVSVELTCNDFGQWFNKDKKVRGKFQKLKVSRAWQILSVQSAPNSPRIFKINYSPTETFDRRHLFKIQLFPQSTVTMLNKNTGDTLRVSIDHFKPRKIKFLRKRTATSYGIGVKGWPHRGFPHIRVGKLSGLYPFKKYKLNRRKIKKLMASK